MHVYYSPTQGTETLLQLWHCKSPSPHLQKRHNWNSLWISFVALVFQKKRSNPITDIVLQAVCDSLNNDASAPQIKGWDRNKARKWNLDTWANFSNAKKSQLFLCMSQSPHLGGIVRPWDMSLWAKNYYHFPSTKSHGRGDIPQLGQSLYTAYTCILRMDKMLYDWMCFKLDEERSLWGVQEMRKQCWWENCSVPATSLTQWESCTTWCV